MSRYRLTNMAEADLARIWLYIAEDRPTAADRQIAKLREAFRFLAKNPNVGEPRPKLGPRMRVFSVKGYVIYFHTVNDGIEIVRVVHGAREIRDLNSLD